jgi:hypothetical protein
VLARTYFYQSRNNAALAEGANWVSVSAVDVWSNATNLATFQAFRTTNVSMTINISPDLLYRNTITLTASITPATYDLRINGVLCTNIGGSLTATDVPVTPGGTAVFECVASPTGQTPTASDPRETIETDKPPRIYVAQDDATYKKINTANSPHPNSTFTKTWLFTHHWVDGNGGDCGFSSIYRDDWYLKATCALGASRWPDVLMGAWTINAFPSYVTNQLPTQMQKFGWDSCNVSHEDWSLSSDGETIYSYSYEHSAHTTVKLFTGGKSHRKSLFKLSCNVKQINSPQATPWEVCNAYDEDYSPEGYAYYAYKAIEDSTRVTIGSEGRLGTDGALYKVYADGQNIDITPKAAGLDAYTFMGMTFVKHELNIFANGVRLDSPTNAPVFSETGTNTLVPLFSANIDYNSQITSRRWTMSPAFNVASSNLNTLAVRWSDAGLKSVSVEEGILFPGGQTATVPAEGWLRIAKARIAETNTLMYGSPCDSVTFATSNGCSPGLVWSVSPSGAGSPQFSSGGTVTCGTNPGYYSISAHAPEKPDCQDYASLIVVGVDMFFPETGYWITNDPFDTYVVAAAPTNASVTNLIVYATSTAGIDESNLPSGWQMTGGSSVVNEQGKISRTERSVDITKPGAKIITCASGCVGVTNKIIVEQPVLTLAKNIVFVNSDDDNGNGTNDMNEPSSGALSVVNGENDLVSLSLSMTSPGRPDEYVTLSSGSLWGYWDCHIRIWGSPQRGTNQPLIDYFGGSVTWPLNHMPATVWIEGIDASSLKNDVTLVLQTEYGASASCNLTVIQTALVADSNNNGYIQENDNALKMTTPGKLVYLNRDDDNTNDIEDRVETVILSGEDDLQPLQISFNPSGIHGSLTLSCDSGSSNIKLWPSSQKGALTNYLSLPLVWNVLTDTPPSSVYVEGINVGQSTLKLQFTATNGCVYSDRVMLTVVNVTFQTNSGTAYGYDNGTVDNNPVARSSDNLPQKYDWVSVGNTNTTQVSVFVDPPSAAPYVFFESTDPSIFALSQSNATSSPRLLQIRGVTNTGNSKLFTRLGSTNGAVSTKLNVSVYAWAVKKADFFNITATNLEPSALTATDIQGSANSFLYQAVARIELNNIGNVNSSYDTNNNGHLDYYSDIGGGGEWTAILNAMAGSQTATNTIKILHLKRSIYVHNGTNFTEATGFSLKNSHIVVFTDASESKERTLAHEMLHEWSLSDIGPEGQNSRNIMYYVSSATKFFIGAFKVESVTTGNGLSNTPKTFERQWDKLSR